LFACRNQRTAGICNQAGAALLVMRVPD